MDVSLHPDQLLHTSTEGFDHVAFIRFVAPTVALSPFYETASLKIDDITYQNKGKLLPESCKRLFGLLWPSFRQSLSTGQIVSLEEARSYLQEKDQRFVSPTRLHVVFKHQENRFVAELQPSEDGAPSLCRCWRVPSKDIHPDTIMVHFGTVAEKERVDAIAAALGYEPAALLLELAMEFARKFERTKLVPRET